MAWVASPALPSAAHTACLLGSGRLHFTTATVLRGQPVALVSLKLLEFLAATGLLFHQ